MKGICFQAWSKSSWEYRVEMQVREKLDALDETMIKQKEIWSLRIAELKGALQQAKRAKVQAVILIHCCFAKGFTSSSVDFQETIALKSSPNSRIQVYIVFA